MSVLAMMFFCCGSTIQAAENDISSIPLNDDPMLIATLSKDRVVISTIETGQEVSFYKLPKGVQVIKMSFAPDEKYVAILFKGGKGVVITGAGKEHMKFSQDGATFVLFTEKGIFFTRSKTDVMEWSVITKKAVAVDKAALLKKLQDELRKKKKK